MGNRWSASAPADGVPFHPYYTVHDIFAVSVFLLVFSAIVFFAPEFGGYFLEYNNFIPADPLKTPSHIAPVWYFTPFYSMLRAITSEMMYVLIGCTVLGALLGVTKCKSSLFRAAVLAATALAGALMLSIDAKFWGVLVMGGAVVILFFLPWLDNSPVRSIRYRTKLAQICVWPVRHQFCCSGLPGRATPLPGGRARLAGWHPVLLRLLLAHALVEPYGAAPGCTQPREFCSPLSPGVHYP